MSRSTSVFVIVVLLTLLAVAILGNENQGATTSAESRSQSATTRQTTPSSSVVITATKIGNVSDTYFANSCVITGVGGFAFRVVSDSTGSPVSGETIGAVGRLGCNNEVQVVNIESFSVGQDGWITPNFPTGATPAGGLNLTVFYQGGAFNFTAGPSPIGSECVTLHVPSGRVTSENVMNGEGSYCYQG